MPLLNKIVEARYDDNQLLVNSTADYKPVAKLLVTTNKVVCFSNLHTLDFLVSKRS